MTSQIHSSIEDHLTSQWIITSSRYHAMVMADGYDYDYDYDASWSFLFVSFIASWCFWCLIRLITRVLLCIFPLNRFLQQLSSALSHQINNSKSTATRWQSLKQIKGWSVSQTAPLLRNTQASSDRVTSSSVHFKSEQSSSSSQTCTY